VSDEPIGPLTINAVDGAYILSSGDSSEVASSPDAFKDAGTGLSMRARDNQVVVQTLGLDDAERVSLEVHIWEREPTEVTSFWERGWPHFTRCEVAATGPMFAFTLEGDPSDEPVVLEAGRYGIELFARPTMDDSADPPAEEHVMHVWPL